MWFITLMWRRWEMRSRNSFIRRRNIIRRNCRREKKKIWINNMNQNIMKKWWGGIITMTMNPLLKGHFQHSSSHLTISWTSPNENISPSVLPHFHGNSIEDQNKFFFDFDILYRSYDYTSNEEKLILFPATLKDNVLHWFMSPSVEIVTTWDQMK